MDKQQMKHQKLKDKCILMMLAAVMLSAVMLVWTAWEISRANAAKQVISEYVLAEATGETPAHICLCFRLTPRETRLAARAVTGNSAAMHALLQSTEGGEPGVILTELLADVEPECLLEADRGAGTGLLFERDIYSGTVQLIGYISQ